MTLSARLTPDDPDGCTAAVLTAVPEFDGYTITQLEDGAAQPDVVALTREMVEQLITLTQTDALSARKGFPNGLH